MRRFISILMIVLTLAFSASAQQCILTRQDLQSFRGASPTEVNTLDGPGTCGFLKFSWQAFIAMNWPAIWNFDRSDTTRQTRGLPDQTKIIGQGFPSEPSVWELFQPNWYVFAVNNPPPAGFAGWNPNASIPSACGQLMEANASRLTDAQRASLRMLSSLSKFDAMPGVSQAFSSPIIDQEGYYARYEILTSFETFDYIVSNKFYSAKAQQGKTIQFPTQSGNRPGAIFLKAAWKVLSDTETKSGRFHTTRAFLFTPGNGSVKSTCAGPVVVGLVGLHIVEKTAGFPGWIWTTFEQVDNSPDNPANPLNPATNNRWSFWRANSTTGENKEPNCPDGASPCLDWKPTIAHKNSSDPTGGPTQVVRKNPIANSPNQGANRFLDQINQAVQDAFREINPSSVWQFYRLVDAQWHTVFTQSNPQFFPATSVANITMETYKQENNSCLECHQHAKSAAKTPSDFTFEFQLGWDPPVLPTPSPTLAGITSRRFLK